MHGMWLKLYWIIIEFQDSRTKYGNYKHTKFFDYMPNAVYFSTL